jgi:hypothetical protein
MDLTHSVMALMDENKGELKDSFYVDMANLLKKTHEKKQKDYKKYEIVYIHTQLKKGGANERAELKGVNMTQWEDGYNDSDDPFGNEFTFYQSIDTKVVYMKDESLKKGSKISFSSEDGLVTVCNGDTEYSNISLKKQGEKNDTEVEVFFYHDTLISKKLIK